MSPILRFIGRSRTIRRALVTFGVALTAGWFAMLGGSRPAPAFRPVTIAGVGTLAGVGSTPRTLIVNYPIEQYVRGVGCLGPARASARETSADVVISLRQSEYLFTDPPEGCHLIDRSANATVRLRSAIGGRRVRGVALARGGFTSFSPLMHSFVGLAPHDAKLMLEPAARVSVRHTGRQTGPLPTVVDQRPRPNRRLTNRRMNRNVLLVVSP